MSRTVTYGYTHPDAEIEAGKRTGTEKECKRKRASERERARESTCTRQRKSEQEREVERARDQTNGAEGVTGLKVIHILTALAVRVVTCSLPTRLVRM